MLGSMLLVASLLKAPPVIVHVRPAGCYSPVITGSGFDSGAIVTIDGRPVPTIKESESSVRAEIEPWLLARPGIGWIEVRNPGGERSKPYPFTRTWERVPSIPATRITGLAASRDPSGAFRLLVSTEKKIYQSQREPWTFTELPTDASLSFTEIVSMAVPRGRIDEIWVGVRLGSAPGIHRTTNGGKTWKSIPVPDGMEPRIMLATPHGAAFAGNEFRVWRLEASGKSVEIPTILSNGQQTLGSMALDKSGTVWAVVGGNLCRLSTGKPEWQVESGDLGWPADGLTTDPAGREILVGVGQQLFVSVDGKRWSRLPFPTSPAMRDPRFPDRFWAALSSGVLASRPSVDDRREEMRCTSLPDRSGPLDVFDPSGRLLFSATQMGLFRLPTPPPSPEETRRK